jgi:hypothetical protein
MTHNFQTFRPVTEGKSSQSDLPASPSARLSPYSEPFMPYGTHHSPQHGSPYGTYGSPYGSPYVPYSPQHGPPIYIPHMSPITHFFPNTPNSGPYSALRTESPVPKTELRTFPICSKVCGWGTGIVHDPCIWCNK